MQDHAELSHQAGVGLATGGQVRQIGLQVKSIHLGRFDDDHRAGQRFGTDTARQAKAALREVQPQEPTNGSFGIKGIFFRRQTHA